MVLNISIHTVYRHNGIHLPNTTSYIIFYIYLCIFIYIYIYIYIIYIVTAYTNTLRNVLFAPSSTNKYAGSMFPGIVDSYHDIEKYKYQSKSAPTKIRKWNSILKQMSIVRLFLLSAADLLNSHGTF